VIGIYGTASAGQVVLRLAAPQRSGAGAPQFTVSMTLAGPRGTAAALPVRGCGQGCVVAAARWARGNNLLTIRAAASGWPGGTTSLAVPWPPAAGEPLLRAVVAAMGRVPAMTVYEQVTSDSTLGAGAAHAIPVSGRFFLQQEPYAGGVAPVADLAPGVGGQRLLLLGFPGDGIWAELAVGAPGAPDRIAREILIDPDHLIRRGFSYLGATARS
jgi:copper transport protein